ncbi:RNA polymerase sigma factor [Shinella sp.]|uniref:RNA polymerase sigma factor n=1 Tax=Shinella sp. TaxID=1870904 RepID=UPI003F7019D8
MTNPTPERLKQIERAIRKLPRLQRAVFCAIRFEDLTYTQIAERHGLTVVEVEAVFARALLNVMRRLDWKPRRWWHWR